MAARNTPLTVFRQMKDYRERAKVPYQTYANRSDIAGGSLGNISTAHVSVSSVDIGLPQRVMHSAVETAGMKDTEYAVRALKEFWANDLAAGILKKYKSVEALESSARKVHI